MSYWIDQNAITRNSKKLKQFIKYNEKCEKEIDKMQAKINKIEWTDETQIERIRLYQQLGKVIELFRNNRIRIQGIKESFLGNNITG